MNNPENISPASKSILAGLLTGVIAAFVNLIYAIIYRDVAQFDSAEIIMPLTIFIGFPILLTMAGYAYFLLKKHLKGGKNWFILFCVAFMITLVLVTIKDTHKDSGTLFSGLRGLCLGLEVITGILAAMFIPYFASHPNIYE